MASEVTVPPPPTRVALSNLKSLVGDGDVVVGGALPSATGGCDVFAGDGDEEVGVFAGDGDVVVDVFAGDGDEEVGVVVAGISNTAPPLHVGSSARPTLVPKTRMPGSASSVMAVLPSHDPPK